MPTPPHDLHAVPDWAMSARERNNAARASQGLPPQPRSKWPWALLILAMGAGGGWYALQDTPPADLPAVASAQALVMEINPQEHATITLGPVDKSLRITGTITPRAQASVSGPVGGRVIEVAVREGDEVEGGDVLVRLDPEPLEIARALQQSNVAAIEAQLELAQSQLERTQTLFSRGSATEAQRDSARGEAAALQAQLQASRDSLQSATLDLRNATIRAPMAGTITQRGTDPGATIAAGTTVVTIADLGTVELHAQTPVSNGNTIKVGQQVRVEADGAPSVHAGEVRRINPVADAASRSLSVFVHIPNPDGELFGGMYATAAVGVDTHPNAVLVPEGAVRTDDTGSYVLRVQKDRLERQDVEATTDWAPNQTLITQGLSTGDTIITAPLPELEPGDRVALVEATP